MENLKWKYIFLHALRFLYGAVFIYSAFAKLYPIEGFELFVLENSFLSWNLSTVASRLLIALELGLGVFLWLNIYSKQIQKLAIAILSAFTVYLLFLHFSKNNVENCNCFGSHLELTPLESIFKNIILIGIGVFLYKFRTSFSFKSIRSITFILIVIVLLVPFVLSPPDFMVKHRYDNEIEGELNLQLLDVDFVYNNNEYDLSSGKWIVCFYSTGCKFCKMSNNKITRFVERHDLPERVFIFFLGSENEIQEFWNDSNSDGFPYEILSPAEFFTVGGNRLPSIFFINDKKIEHHCLYRDLFEEDVTTFLE